MSYEGTIISQSESPTVRCDYCRHPFPTTDRLVLHKGIEHPQQLNDSEEKAFFSAQADEEDELRTLRLKALGGLVLLYFGLLFMYAIFA
ncbi:DNA-binding protein [Halobaculum sp. WSA2]|uniref:DNA-binding protein n=1 Tax=Halobaculum saliterrae TaxID=2073113 RepID=A0A6B0T455_9EURY|nr:DNA-binding protein [Halobaculum saliterrae]MXR43100.1 DNA-binding protein [Halobaculum saliterrae]